jgi:hypothetical protein
MSPLFLKTVLALCLPALLAPAVAAPPVTAPPAASDLTSLIGTWKVDLRAVPDATPYYQNLVITSVENGRLKGKFYGTAFEDSSTNKDWGPIYFAFTTSDRTGAYHTAGRLVNGRLEGTTQSIGRGFLSVWTAERQGTGQSGEGAAPAPAAAPTRSGSK